MKRITLADSSGVRLSLVMALCLLVPGAISLLTVEWGVLVPVILIAFSILTIFLVTLFRNPAVGLLVLLANSFLFIFFDREIRGFNYINLTEGILIITWFAAFAHYSKEEWKHVWNDLFILMSVWFVISVLEMLNPATNFSGAVRELRSVALHPLLIIPVGFLVFNRYRYMDIFLSMVLLFSAVAALNGVRQLHVGLLPGEQLFLDQGGEVTHVLWGKLRVFSIYSDAGQFGASMAHIGLVSLILALGPIPWWKRMLLLCLSVLLFYGMLISGTRGALFALISGGVFAVFLSKNFRMMAIGAGLLLLVVGFLKFTTIGNSNYEIYRLRTALDPQDASLNVRFASQEVLADYLDGRPFGDGLGSIGFFGMEYNGHTFLSTIQPDSYWVKVWAMYGIVGLVIWMGIMMYILGKCCGIVWNIRDKGLRVKLIALTSGAAGVFFCSYGNEVVNSQPSSFIVYFSWIFVFLGPRFDKELTAMHHRN